MPSTNFKAYHKISHRIYLPDKHLGVSVDQPLAVQAAVLVTVAQQMYVIFPKIFLTHD
jgi:hypothetical protein